ncbi:unnamed protein product [Alopecurus aequalis]
MQKDTSSSDVSASHVGRVRNRRRHNETATDGNGANGPTLLVSDQNKYKSMLIRTYSTLWMIGGFVFVIYMGHLYVWAMVVVIQIFMATELFNLLRKSTEEKQLPGFRLLNWHFFFTAMLFTYGRFLSRELVNTVSSDHLLYKVVSGLIKYQMFICYFLYTAGFVWFILTLKKKTYNYQFKQYAWTHMILLTVFAQSSFTVANIFEGMFWFLLPASLIVINDIAAYLFGFFLGRTPLIKLSPKKTWEGFIGASVTTIISAFLLANVMGHFPWLTCPRKDLSTGWLVCDPAPLFKPEHYFLGDWVPQWFPWKEVFLLPVQWHALALGLFASIIAPFGGFFASGFKRAFKIKYTWAWWNYRPNGLSNGHGSFCIHISPIIYFAPQFLCRCNLGPDFKKPNLRGAEILIPATWGDDRPKAIYVKLRIAHTPLCCGSLCSSRFMYSIIAPLYRDRE